MGAPIRSGEFTGRIPPQDAGSPRTANSGLQALSSFVDTAVPALLLLTLMATEQNSETVPDLKRLATMLNEWQDVVGPEGAPPSAVSRLYQAVNNLKAQSGRPDA